MAELRPGVCGGTEDSNKLHCWAGADRGRRFDDLYNLVWDPTGVDHGVERVAGHRARTAGVDRATVAWIVSRYGVETFLHEVRDQLRSRTFTPAPVRQVMIPKASRKLRARHPDRHRPGRAGRAETGPGTDLRGRLRRSPTGSGPAGARRTPSLRSTTSRRSRTSGCWRPTSRRVSTTSIPPR